MRRFLKPVFITLIFFLIFARYFRHITALTQDLGRHFKTGELIIESGIVPKTNLFSYTYPDFPFINHHWLSEIIFYLTHLLGGFPLLFALSLILILVGFGIIFFYAFNRFLFPSLVIATCLYLPILFDRTDLRPELFSFFFLSVFVVILYIYRERFSRVIYILPLIMLLWVNIHIYFFIGIVILFLFLFDEILRERKRLTNRHTKTLALITLVSCIAILFNPNTIDGALYPLRVFDNYGYTIEENQTFYLLESLGFQKPSIPFFKLGVFLLFGSLLINVKKTRRIDWLLSIIFTIIGTLAVRNFPLFVFATFIPLCIGLTNTLTFFSEKLKKYPSAHISFLQYFGYACLFLFLFFQIQKAVSSETFGYHVADNAGPGVDFLIENDIQGPLFNNFDIGSYLSYRLYPKERVFIDGRPEAYPKDFIQEVYIPIQQSSEQFHNAETQYHFKTIFFSHTDQTPWANQFLKDILLDTTWSPVYLDDTVLILVKNSPKHADFIKRFGMTKDTLKISNLDRVNRKSLLQLASFFNKTGLTTHELQMYQHLLSLDPTDCLAMYNSGVLLSQRNDPGANIFAVKYQQFCTK